MRPLEMLDNVASTWYPLECLYIPLRRLPLLRRFRKTREYYHRIATQQGLTYKHGDVAQRTRQRLSSRGYTPVKKPLGQLHTFAFIPRVGWHDDLYCDLARLGDVSEFDYTKAGYGIDQFLSASSPASRDRREMNLKMLDAIRTAHATRPIDWMFMYATGSEIMPSTIRAIQDELGFPVVGMCLDDKQSWQGPSLGDYFGLQIDIAPLLDLSWTSSLVSTEWYLALGGNPIHLPEGTNPNVYFPASVAKDLEVSFVGARYGFRHMRVRHLQRNGIEIQAYGNGWKDGSQHKEGIVKVFNRSKINLGMGGIGYAEHLTTLKGRDFDIPCSGNLYLTSFNPELAVYFQVGKEILCYRTAEELIEMIRYYLVRPDEAAEIAAAGRKRCLSEHTWYHRYEAICRTLGVL